MRQTDIGRARPAQEMDAASPVGEAAGEGLTAAQFFGEAGAVIAVCLGLALLARVVVAVVGGA